MVYIVVYILRTCLIATTLLGMPMPAAIADDPVQTELRLPKATSLDLTNLVPPKVYGISGKPVEIYFQNLGLIGEDDDFFVVTACTCNFGITERRRWIGIPKDSDVGTHTLSILITRQSDKKRFYYSVQIFIKKERTDLTKLRLLIIGDSITRQQFYPNKLVRDLKERLQLDVSTFGNVALSFADGYDVTYTEPAQPGVYTESYNGLTTGKFLHRDWTNLGSSNTRSKLGISPFWDRSKKPNGKFSLDHYVNSVGGGSPPDIIMIMLGTNDVASARYDGESPHPHIDKLTQSSLKNMEKIIKLLRVDAVNRPIFIITPPPTTNSETAVAYSYGEMKSHGYTASQIKRSIFSLLKLQTMQFENREDENIFFVPNFIGFDVLDGYMQPQVVHPSRYGHRQMASQIYARLVHALSEKNVTDAIRANRQTKIIRPN